MKTLIMGGGRITCLTLLVLVNLNIVVAKPFFGVFCDLLCEDDDDYDTSVSTTTSMEDVIWDMMDPCSACPTTRPRTPRPVTASPMQGPLGQPVSPFNFIPPPGGVNFTMGNQNGMWYFNSMPWNWWGPGPWFGGSPPPMGTPNPAAATPAPAATTPAPAATTAAPAATTAAAGATTAAPGATTAAPAATTAKPA